MTTTATALQSPKQWLESFFEQRKLRQPDGRKLYAYRLSPAEYESLRALLRHWGPHHWPAPVTWKTVKEHN